MEAIKEAVRELLKSDLQLHTCMGQLEVLLRDKVHMDFELMYSFGDGFMIR